MNTLQSASMVLMTALMLACSGDDEKDTTTDDPTFDPDSDADTDTDTDTDTLDCSGVETQILSISTPVCNKNGYWELTLEIQGWSSGGVAYVRETEGNSWGEQHSYNSTNDSDECVSTVTDYISVVKKKEDASSGRSYFTCDTKTLTWWFEIYNAFSAVSDCVVIGHDPTYNDVPAGGPDPYTVPGNCRTL